MLQVISQKRYRRGEDFHLYRQTDLEQKEYLLKSKEASEGDCRQRYICRSGHEKWALL